MNEQIIEAVKQAMGYKDQHYSCRYCRHFVPTDCSGSTTAKNKHCKLNPAFDIPVHEDGVCRHHDSTGVVGPPIKVVPEPGKPVY